MKTKMNDQKSKEPKDVNYANHLNLDFSQMILSKDVQAIFIKVKVL